MDLQSVSEVHEALYQRSASLKKRKFGKLIKKKHWIKLVVRIGTVPRGEIIDSKVHRGILLLNKTATKCLTNKVPKKSPITPF